MLTRYTGMSTKSQSYLFSFGLLLTFLGMALTDMWLPMVVGAFVLTILTLESWIRLLYIMPLREELRAVHRELHKLQSEFHSLKNDQ